MWGCMVFRVDSLGLGGSIHPGSTSNWGYKRVYQNGALLGPFGHVGITAPYRDYGGVKDFAGVLSVNL